MKKMNILKGMLLVFLAFQFYSCEDEPLTGEFPDGDHNGAEVGQFKARIAGEEFIATSVSATLSEDQKLTLTGSNSSGESITLVVNPLVESNYTLGNVEIGDAWAIYEDRLDSGLPYSTSQVLNAVGNLTFSEIDREAKIISGTFNFKGTRMEVDASGMPVMDGDGLPVMEDIEISNGVFNAIDYTQDGDDDGDGDGDTSEDDFFAAKIDGRKFLTETITVSEPVIGNKHMVKIEARNARNEFMRIDVPKSLGVGEFPFVSLSDGTMLIGIYKPDGGENFTSKTGAGGKIIITEFDLEAGILKATFAFKAHDPLGVDNTTFRITNGHIRIHFEGVPGANNTMTAKVDGENYATDIVNVERTVVNQYPRITLTSRMGDQEIKLSFHQTITEGTYDMVTEVDRGNEIVGTFTPIVGTSISYFSDGGTFVVTSYDMETGIIQGTFNFTAVDVSGQDPTEYQITSGEFLAILP